MTTERKSVFTRGAVAVAAIAVLAACSPGSDASDSSQDQTLVVAALTTPANLDQDVDTSAQSHEIRMNTMERLMAYGLEESPVEGVRQEDFENIEPRLAESWTLDDDGRSMTFHLREGVTSPWGNTFTAHDVAWTWERAWDLNTVGGFYLRSVLKMDEPTWTVHDDHTIEIELPEPNPLLESLWINMDLGIFDSEAAQENATDDDPWASAWIAQNSPSFAPYQVTAWEPGNHVELTAWEDYYRGEAEIPRVVFQQVPESSSRLSLLTNQQAHIGEDLAPRDFLQGESSEAIDAVSLTGNAIYRMELNNEREPFDDTLVRQALNYAVDKDALIEGAFAGTAQVSKSPLPPDYPGYSDEAYEYEHDPQRAVELLEEAGYPNGFETTLSYRADSAIEDSMANQIRTDLEAVGVTVELRSEASSTYLQNILSHQYDSYLYVDSSILPNPSYALNLWLHSSSEINYSQYDNPVVDELIDQMLISSDESNHEELAFQVQAEVMEDPPWVFLALPGYHVHLADNLDGFVWRTPINPVEYINLTFDGVE